MMKRLLLHTVLLCLFALPAASAEKAGDIVFVRGDAAIERGGKVSPARPQAALQQGDRIVTKEGALVKVLFRDDSVLTVGANSSLSVDQYQYDTVQKRSTSFFKLLFGKLRAIVGRTNLSVGTPTAVAGARGTVFFIWYDTSTQTTGVSVIEGEVQLTSNNPSITGSQTLTGGQTSNVPSGGSPTGPKTGQPPPGFDGDGDGTPPPDPGAPPDGGIEGLTPITTPPINQEPNTTRVTIDVVFP